MDTNDDFYGKELNLNCFYMHTNFEQKYPITAIVSWCMNSLLNAATYLTYLKRYWLLSLGGLRPKILFMKDIWLFLGVIYKYFPT